jgi:hypothetical protein
MRPLVGIRANLALSLGIVALVVSSASTFAEEHLRTPPPAVAEQFREWNRDANMAFDPNPIGGAPLQPLMRASEQPPSSEGDGSRVSLQSPALAEPPDPEVPPVTGSTSPSREHQAEPADNSSVNKREFEEWWEQRTRERGSAVQPGVSQTAHPHIRNGAAPRTRIAAPKKRAIVRGRMHRASAPVTPRRVASPVRRTGRAIVCMLKPGCPSGRQVAGTAVGATAGAIVGRGAGAIVGGLIGLAVTTNTKLTRSRRR